MIKKTEEQKLDAWAYGLTIDQLKAARDEYERRVSVVAQIVSRYNKTKLPETNLTRL